MKKENIFSFFKGAFIGFANVIPGVSGGSIAVITGIYDKCLHHIDVLFSNNTKLEKRNALLFLFPIVLGVAFGLVALSSVISFFLDNYREQTFLFFMGLVYGTVPSLFKKANEVSKLKFYHYIIVFLGIALFILMSFMNVSKENATQIYTSVDLNNFYMFPLMGFISIAAMIIPGISGSFLLLILGYYSTFINSIKSFNIPILILFFLGGVFAFFVMVKILNFILKRFHTIFYSIILGLVLGSNLFIFPQLSSGFLGFCSILLFIAGFILASLLGDKDNLFRITKYSIIFIVISFLFALSLLFFTRSKKMDNYFFKEYESGNFLNIAHRGGAFEAPENTMLAFEHAVSVDRKVVLELDVHYIKDKSLVVFHDEDLKLLGIDKNIADLEYKDALNVNVAKNFEINDQKPYEQDMITMPRLEDVLSRFSDSPMVIELKTYKKEAVDAFAKVLIGFNRLDKTIVSIEDHDMTLYLRENYKDILHSASRKEVTDFYKMNLLGISVFYNAEFDILVIPDREYNLPILNPNFINSSLKKNIIAIVYTINDESKLEKYINYFINGIVTDVPSTLKNIIDKNISE